MVFPFLFKRVLRCWKKREKMKKQQPEVSTQPPDHHKTENQMLVQDFNKKKIIPNQKT